MVVYSCDYCQYSTSIKTHFNRHNSTHKHIRNVAFNCEVTKKSIQKVYDGNDHDTNKSFVSNEINYLNDNIHNTIIPFDNTQVTQGNTKKYICDYCESKVRQHVNGKVHWYKFSEVPLGKFD